MKFIIFLINSRTPLRHIIDNKNDIHLNKIYLMITSEEIALS